MTKHTKSRWVALFSEPVHHVALDLTAVLRAASVDVVNGQKLVSSFTAAFTTTTIMFDDLMPDLLIGSLHSRSAFLRVLFLPPFSRHLAFRALTIALCISVFVGVWVCPSLSRVQGHALPSAITTFITGSELSARVRKEILSSVWINNATFLTRFCSQIYHG